MFGRKKNKQDAAQNAQMPGQMPQGQMQISPEALALMQAMQAQQMQAQQLQAQQLQAQQMQAQQLQAQQMMPQQPAMPQAGAPAMSDQDLLAELGAVAPASPIAQNQMPQAMAPQAMAPQAMAPQNQMPPQPADLAVQDQQAPQADMTALSGFPFSQAPDTGMQAAAPGRKKGKLSKDEKRLMAEQKKADKERKKAEKKAQIAEKAEEKKRAKRRKKLAKTRFSRARYLREATGNAIAGTILWVFLILAFIIGPFLLNTAFLIPKTNENLRILSEAKNLERSLVVNRPQITAMAEKRKQKNTQINAFKSGFTPRAEAKAALENLVIQLEEAGLEVAPITIGNAALSAKTIIGTSATFTINGDYLAWLRVRNKFVRSQNALSIPNESVGFNEETGAMEIVAQIVLASRP